MSILASRFLNGGCVALGCLGVMVFSPGTLSGAIIAHYSFDEGTGQTVADSTGATSGQLGSSTESDSADPTFVTGKIGDYSLDFGGSDYVYCGKNNVVTNLAGEKTFSFWTAYQTTDRVDGFLGVDSNRAESRWYLDDNFHGDDLRIYRQADSSSSYLLTTESNVLRTDAWQHVVVIDDGAGWKGYVDGVAVTASTVGASFDFTSFSDPGDVAFWIGRGRHGGNPITLLGQMDDVSVWDNALSATEVQALFGLGNDERLNYNAAQVQDLLGLYETGSGVVTIGDWRWYYAEDIITPAGQLSYADSQYSLALAGDGTGLVGIPEPSAFLLLVAGMTALLLRRSRRDMLR